MTPKTETRLIDSAKRWMTEHGYSRVEAAHTIVSSIIEHGGGSDPEMYKKVFAGLMTMKKKGWKTI